MVLDSSTHFPYFCHLLHDLSKKTNYQLTSELEKNNVILTSSSDDFTSGIKAGKLEDGWDNVSICGCCEVTTSTVWPDDGCIIFKGRILNVVLWGDVALLEAGDPVWVTSGEVGGGGGCRGTYYYIKINNVVYTERS